MVEIYFFTKLSIYESRATFKIPPEKGYRHKGKMNCLDIHEFLGCRFHSLLEKSSRKQSASVKGVMSNTKNV